MHVCMYMGGAGNRRNKEKQGRARARKEKSGARKERASRTRDPLRGITKKRTNKQRESK